MTTYAEFAARGRNAAWRYALTLALTLVFAIAGGAILIFVLQAARLLPADFTDHLLVPDNPNAFFLANAALFGLLLASMAAAIMIVHRKAFGDVVGLWRWERFLAGAGLWIGAMIAMALIDFAIAPDGFSLSADHRTGLLVLTAIPALAIQTFAEEFIFRGYVTQGILLAVRRIVPTALISGVIFGALHIPNGGPQAISATIFGTVLALVAIRTNGLAFAFGLHMANNLFAAVVLVSGNDVFKGAPGLFSQTTPQLMWWDTVIAALALCVVAVIAVRRWGTSNAVLSP